MSARSRFLPSPKNRQLSSLLRVDSDSPANMAARPFTQPKKACGIWPVAAST